jgi:hypothetical protein
VEFQSGFPVGLHHRNILVLHIRSVVDEEIVLFDYNQLIQCTSDGTTLNEPADYSNVKTILCPVGRENFERRTVFVKLGAKTMLSISSREVNPPRNNKR